MERTEKLVKQAISLKDAGLRYWKRRIFIADSFSRTTGEPEPLRRAKTFKNVLEHTEPVVHDDELIVGSVLGIYPLADSVTAGREIYPDLKEFFRHKLDGRLADIKGDIHWWSGAYDLAKSYSEENGVDYEAVLSQVRRLLYDLEEERKPLQKEREYLLDEVEIEKSDRDPIEGWGAPHHIAVDYEKLLRVGYGGLLDEVDVRLRNLREDESGYEDKRVFLEAAAIALRAASDFILSYSDKARALADGAEGDRREELIAIGDVCRKIAVKPAESFREALQLFWLTHVILSVQGGIALAAGRLDQYTYPHYIRDIEANRLTRDDALRLLEAMWVKFNEPGLGTVQCVTIGGQHVDGSDATNELSYLCLEATANVKLPYPNLAARCHDASPAEYYLKISHSLKQGTGLPAVFNDETVIPGLVDIAVSPEDARNYCVIGCVETGMPGSQAPYETCLVNLAQGLELALRNGVGRVDKKQLGPATGDPRQFGSFEELVAAVKLQLNCLIDEKLKTVTGEAFYRAPHHNRSCPFASSLVDGCIEKGKDIYHGGPDFKGFTGIFGIGLGTVADSLAAIKNIIYEKQLLTMDDLIRVLQSDFEGEEDVRLLLKNKAPKYGNDCDYADEIARDIGGFFGREILSRKGPRGEWCIPVMMSYLHNINFGRITGATPDGRKAGEPLSNGLSPSQGVDFKGPTAVVCSVTKLDHKLFPGGSVLNMMFHGGSIAGDKGLKDLAAFTRSFIEMRGGQIQTNVVSTQTLKEAKIHPENYRSLLVRVSGFSEHFTKLHPDAQDEIIARTEHGTA